MTGETFNYQEAQLESWDFVVLFLYFASILGVGIWVSCPKSILTSKNIFQNFSIKSHPENQDVTTKMMTIRKIQIKLEDISWLLKACTLFR